MSPPNAVLEKSAPHGPQGQSYLAAGEHIALRLWDEQPGDAQNSVSARDYETVGYVLEGQATVTLGSQSLELKPGVSWVIPKGAEHSYQIREHFRAIEATSPPAREAGRDATTGGRQYSPADVLA